jgi:hypothetical protein
MSASKLSIIPNKFCYYWTIKDKYSKDGAYWIYLTSIKI